MVLSLYFGSQRIEEWQLRREVEKYRIASQDQPSQLAIGVGIVIARDPSTDPDGR